MVTYPRMKKNQRFLFILVQKINLQVCHVMTWIINSVVFPFVKYKYVISGLRHFKFAGEVEGGCVSTH